MQIFILRHGKAEMESESGLDRDRKLILEGKRELVQVGQDLKRRAEAIEKIFTSPYIRAKESAEIIQKHIACARGLEVMEELASGAQMKQQLLAIEKISKRANSFLLVGHMPDLGILADYFLGDQHEISLKPGNLLKIEINDLEKEGSGRLIYSI